MGNDGANIYWLFAQVFSRSDRFNVCILCSRGGTTQILKLRGNMTTELGDLRLLYRRLHATRFDLETLRRDIRAAARIAEDAGKKTLNEDMLLQHKKLLRMDAKFVRALSTLAKRIKSLEKVRDNDQRSS